MKTLKKIAALSVMVLLGFGAQAQFLKAEIQVSGLTCSMCQLATEKAIKTLDFVADVKPDLNKNVFVISFKKDRAVNLDMIKKKVKGAGFSVSKLVTVFNFTKLQVSNNFHFNYGGNTYHFMDIGEKTLDGPVRLTILDKDFIPAGEYKNRSAKTTYECYRTGMMAGTRTYHVTL